MNFPADNSSLPDRNHDAIEATAGVWLSLRDRGMTPKETEAFVRWLQESPEHAAMFSALEQTWQQFDQLSNVVAPGAAANPDTLAPRYYRRVAKLPVISLAAAAVLTLLCIGSWTSRRPRHFAETAVGAFQRVYLPDGSVAQLNTDSAIDVDMSGADRRVRVVHGEVHFAVHKDPQHPFLVAANGIQVRAVGTAFDVHCCRRTLDAARGETTTTEVIVTEGRVQVTDVITGETVLTRQPGTSQPPVLGAGERILIPAGPAGTRLETPISQLSATDLKRALAWQERRLEFDKTPLREVLAEFNRYNRVKLTVVSERLALRPFSGTFRVDGYEALVALLEENFGVVAIRSSDDIQLVDK